MTWANEYINLPFKEVGRERDGVDCYGLLRLVYRERLNILLPAYTDYETTQDHNTLKEQMSKNKAEDRWVEIPAGQERPFDVMLIRIVGLPIHLGIVTDVKKHVLHIERGSNAVHEDYRFNSWKAPGKIIGYYRHPQLCLN